MRLKNAVVVITGASGGIGAATALAFARRRARLVLGSRRLDRLQAVADRCRRLGAPEVMVRRADVSREAEAKALVGAALRDFERIDVLVNNAGIGWTGRCHEMPAEAVEQLLRTNLFGTIWATQAALPNMLGRRSGVIVNVASIVGFRAMPYASLYSASKHAVVGFSHGLRGELSGTGVKVGVVYPAATATEFFSRLETGPTGPVYPVDWVARTIVHTARFPRRDAMVLPIRLLQLIEPVFGGLLDHLLGESQRAQWPSLKGPGRVDEFEEEIPSS